MTVHQCPKCELRFTWKTELDQHCRDEHPDFQHDYPVAHRIAPEPPTPTPPTPPR
jgi:hypothetical protein